ncbi:MAG: YkgJ family cysteine cluster protein [Planctomycetota bacterium]
MSVPRTEGATPLALLAGGAIGGVDVRRFACRPGCGRCCGYKVSVLEEDIRRLEAGGAARGEFLDGGREPAKGFAGCLRKRGGFCALLDGERRCSEYERRPLYCRLYPYVREAYVELQVDVDLSCPGVGEGEVTPEEELWRGIEADDAATDHEAILRGRRREIETAERILAYRSPVEPFAEVAERIGAAGERGAAALREHLSSLAGGMEGGARPEALGEEAEEVIRDYLVFWSRRQLLWRWADSFAVATLDVRTRTEAIAGLLLDVGEAVRRQVRRRGGEGGGRNALCAIREHDSRYRTYCRSFRLEG